MRQWVMVCILVFCGSLAGLAQAAAAKPLSPLEQTLFSAEKGFIEAAKKGDQAFLKRTLADDFTFVGFDGEPGERQDLLDGIGGGGVDLLPYEMKVSSVSDDVAIVSYNVVMRVPPAEDQDPPPRYQHWSSVWAKSGDTWKMKFMQMTVAHFGDW